MVIVQNGLDNERGLRTFINMFFKTDEDLSVFSNFEYKDKKINVYTVIYFENKKYTEDYYLDFDTENKSEKLINKVFKAACANSFVHAAMKIQNINLPWGSMCGIRPAKNVRELAEDGLNENEIREMFETVYEVSPDKTELAMTVAENEKEILKNIGKNSVGIYIGIPFCPTRCLYCSFVSTDMKFSAKYMDDFCDKLVLEIEKTAEIIKKLGVYVESIYIGGGTPTALDNENLRKVLENVNKFFNLENLKEFTLEAGRADTITREKLDTAKKYGVTRISINPQTMNDETLKKVGRMHTSEDVKKCFFEAREAGFDNINMDLIAGLPDENFEMFKKSIDEVAALNPDDITVHTMCVKHGARLKNTEVEFTESAIMNKMLSYAQKKMKETGRIPYYMYRQKNMVGNLENVGYAYPDKMSTYNISIMEEKQTIIALGGGGSTKIVTDSDIIRIYNYKDPKEYIDKFENILERKDEILKVKGVM